MIFLNEKKNVKGSDHFWHRKFMLNIRILLFVTTQK